MSNGWFWVEAVICGVHVPPAMTSEVTTPPGPIFKKLPAFLKLTNTDPFAAWFVVTGDATPPLETLLGTGIGSFSSGCTGVPRS